MQRKEEQRYMLSFAAMACQVVRTIYWNFLAYYVSRLLILHISPGDAYHITQPHSDGKGALLAMKRALKQVTSWF